MHATSTSEFGLDAMSTSEFGLDYTKCSVQMGILDNTMVVPACSVQFGIGISKCGTGSTQKRNKMVK
jgi:hypothetical protein